MNDPRSEVRDHFQAKKEDDPNYSIKFPKIPNSSRHWSSYKNPRIVRVSRAFGGKDRHSKVCTTRGLRDRRIRLSVPTAIQLYDLQEKLGLSMPSKVVDWLLDATQTDIDKLPPLPMLPAIHQSVHESPNFFTPNYSKEGIVKDLSNDQPEGFGGFVPQISAQNLFPLNNSNQSSNFPNFSYNPYNNFHWDPPEGLSLYGGGYAFPNNQVDDHRPLQSSSDQYFCPPAAMPSFIPSGFTFPSSLENNELRQNSHQQQNNPAALFPTTLNLISPPVKSLVQHHHNNHVLNLKSVYSSQESDSRRVLLKDNNSK